MLYVVFERQGVCFASKVSDMSKIKKYLRNTVCSYFPGLFSKYKYWRLVGKKLDLRNPKGLDAKIMWLKLHTYKNNQLVTKCADKYAVRDYISDCGCSEILNDLYGVWERAEDIDWDSLPSSFVLKCNHGCGYNLLCPDKNSINSQEAINTLDQWMNEDFWLELAEIQYRNIPKRIICEKYLGDSLVDYKFYCFNGKPTYVLICVGRNGGQPSHVEGYEDPKFFFFDRDWKMCKLTRDSLNCSEDFIIPKPANIEKMWETADKLCRPFPFVRVDLYDVEGRIFFGELTFTPSAAMDTSRLPETDLLFGNLLTLK